jgi:hypothetical protein
LWNISVTHLSIIAKLFSSIRDAGLAKETLSSFRPPKSRGITGNYFDRHCLQFYFAFYEIQSERPIICFAIQQKST